MIHLPVHPRRAWLRSFWFAVALLGGLVMGGTLAVFVSWPWFGVGAILGLVMALPGLLFPQIVAPPYRAWYWLSEWYMRLARFIIKGICFYVVFGVAGLAGSSLKLTPPSDAESCWLPRKTLPPTSNLHQYDAPPLDHRRRGWQATYISWAVRSGNWWAIGLLPFLIILAPLEPEEDQSFPANIYTLF